MIISYLKIVVIAIVAATLSLFIISVILSLFKRKNVIMSVVNVKRVTTTALVIFILLALLYTCFVIYQRRIDIAIFLRSSEYKNPDAYDYSNDIANYGFITGDGAIKIAYEYVNNKHIEHYNRYYSKGADDIGEKKIHTKIAEVKCYRVENGTYETSVEDDDSELFPGMIAPSSHLEKKQATYWMVSFITNRNQGGHAEEWDIKVDCYTGEILEAMTSM